MRVAVLPREIAARVITSALARGAWAVNAANLALTIPILVEFMVLRGHADDLVLPVAMLVLMLFVAVVAALNPRPWLVVVFLVLGALATFAYEVSLIASYPPILDEGYFALNRPAVSLVLVGVASTTWASGLVWSMVGFIVSSVVSVLVSWATTTTLKTGWGPVLMLLLYVVAYLVLAGIQRSQRKRVPNFEELEEETRRLEVEENLRARVTAVVHDTLLNDLSIVMNAPDELDSRVTDRLRADIATLRSTEWREESAKSTVVDEQDADLRNQLMVMISDFQWRGLTVHITGSGSGIYRLDPLVAEALTDAIRACLENALRHSGADVAEVDLAYSETELTVIISDQGTGFDPASIPADRLGLRFSIVDRVSAAGGSTKVWSSPGAGTSIVMRVPVVEVVRPHEDSLHNVAPEPEGEDRDGA